jgi:exodeoxyribonuclease VIII
MAEVSFFWTDPATGIQCKGRADLVVPSYRAIVDIKSTVDAAARPFARDCRRYGYDIQAVTYLDGWKLAGGEPIDNFVVIAVEKEPPYMAAAYEFSLDDLDAARDERARLMSIYDECRRSDSWPGYPGGLQTLTLQARTRTADE